MSKPLCWTAYQKHGIRLLRAVNSDPGTLSTILGPDGPVIAALFSEQDISDGVSEVTTKSNQERFATLMVSGPIDRELSPISVDDSDAHPSPVPSHAPPTTASVGRSTGSPLIRIYSFTLFFSCPGGLALGVRASKQTPQGRVRSSGRDRPHVKLRAYVDMTVDSLLVLSSMSVLSCYTGSILNDSVLLVNLVRLYAQGLQNHVLPKDHGSVEMVENS